MFGGGDEANYFKVCVCVCTCVCTRARACVHVRVHTHMPRLGTPCGWAIRGDENMIWVHELEGIRTNFSVAWI